MIVSHARETSTFRMAFLLIFLEVLLWPNVATSLYGKILVKNRGPQKGIDH